MFYIEENSVQESVEKDFVESTESSEPIVVEEKPLSKKERKKKHKEEKRAKKQADKEFERNAGKRVEKRIALIFGILGTVSAFIPVAMFVGASIVALFCFFATFLLTILLVIGLVFFGLGYLIYSSNTSGTPSLDGYFATATGPAEFGSWLMNKVANLDGLLLTIFAGVGLALEIVSLIFICITAKAFTKGHKARNIVLITLSMVVTVVVLVIGVLRLTGAM